MKTVTSARPSELERPSAYYRQIADLLRRRIEAGELKPGTKLPSTQALAEQWSVNVSTVHSAMTLLVREGWLERVRRRGTFVRQRATTLRRVVLYYKDDVWGEADSQFQQALYRALRDTLAAHGIEVRVMIDTRPVTQQDEPLPELREAIASRQVQGVIFPFSAPPHSSWLDALHSPRALVASGSANYRVDFNQRQFLELAVDALARQGCKSAGMIGARNYGEQFRDIAAARGLRVDPALVISTPGKVYTGRLQKRTGYELTHQWCERAGAAGADGLVVYPDTFAVGAIQALLERRIDVPDALRLVLHRNAGVDLLCPFSVTWVESSEREVAEAVLEQLQRQHRGEVPTPIHIGFRLADGSAAPVFHRSISASSC
ncbi:MAG: GntR family transcriptional regulator [Phycisphaeraceae bacterium]